MTTYTLRYGSNRLDPFDDDAADAATLDELTQLIYKHVERDDYCWIIVNQDGQETGRVQCYNSCDPCHLLEEIETQGEVDVIEQINAREKAVFEQYVTPVNGLRA